jgi:CBS domain-containing protein
MFAWRQLDRTLQRRVCPRSFESKGVATMIAADLMTPEPIVIQPDDDISTAITLLDGTTFRHLPVVDEQGALVGMISDRDLRALLVPHFLRRETVEGIVARAEAPVSSVMTGNVVTVDMEDDVSMVADLIMRHKVGAVPVVDADARLVGIVSYVDLLRYYAAATINTGV